MKLWIIYANKNKGQHYPKQMLKSALDNKIDAELYYAEYFSYQIENNRTTLYYNNQKITKLPSHALARGFEPNIRKYLEKNNVKFVNSLAGIMTTRDKLETHYLAAQQKIAQPLTLYGEKLTYTQIAEKLGKTFIMKDRFGQKGHNVYLIKSAAQFKQVLQDTTEVKYIYQQYIESSKGQDIRLCIAGDKVIGVLRRCATNDDFRSNISLGATATLYNKIPNKIIEQSLKLAKTLNLHFCSVDYLIDGNRYLFCEANSNIGFGGFYENGIDIREKVMQYIKTQLAQPTVHNTNYIWFVFFYFYALSSFAFFKTSLINSSFCEVYNFRFKLHSCASFCFKFWYF